MVTKEAKGPSITDYHFRPTDIRTLCYSDPVSSLLC